MQKLYTIFHNHTKLQKLAKAIHNLDVIECNYGKTPRQERRLENLLKQAEQIAQDFNLHAYHQGDPRGCPLYLVENLQDTQYTNGTPIVW